LLPYVSGNTRVFKCPSTSHEFAWPTNRSDLGFPFPYNIGNSTPFSYGYNGWGVASVGGYGLGVTTLFPLSASKVAKPSDMIAIGDSSGTAWISFHRLLSISIKPPGKRHRDGANIVFVDGHVEWQEQTTWIAHTESAARRWNNDNQPHRNRWISGR
jgi:prepilin-type processing-associated H-X9-DG protein